MYLGYAYIGDAASLAMVHEPIIAPVPPAPTVRDTTGDPRFRAPRIKRPRLRSPMHAAVEVTGPAEHIERVQNARVFVASFSVVRPTLAPTLGCVHASAHPVVRAMPLLDVQLRFVAPRARAKIVVRALDVVVIAQPRLPLVRVVQNPSDDELIAAYLASREL